MTIKVFWSDGLTQEYQASSYSIEGGYLFIKTGPEKVYLIPLDKRIDKIEGLDDRSLSIDTW